MLCPGAINIPPGPRLGQDVLKVHNLSYHVSEPSKDGEYKRKLFENLSFEVPRGAVVGVVGGNGVGKTTLMRMIAGEITPDSGKIEIGYVKVVTSASQTSSRLFHSSTTDQRLSWAWLLKPGTTSKTTPG